MLKMVISKVFFKNCFQRGSELDGTQNDETNSSTAAFC